MGSYGQDQLQFSHLTSEDGLSKNSVLNVYQDSRGFMWFGTRDGLNRYDGYDFTTYREDKFDSTSIQSNIIIDVAEDSDGNLWLVTHKGLSIFKRELETFINYNNDLIDGKRINFDNAVCIYIDKGNRIFVGNKNGIWLFNPKLNKIRSVFSYDTIKIFMDKNGNIWAATAGGSIFQLDGHSFAIKNQYHFDKEDPDGPGGKIVSAFKEDTDGTIWIGYMNGGIDHFTPETGQFKNYLHDPDNPNSLCHNTVRVIADGPSGDLWVGTYKGISSINRSNNKIKFTTIVHQEEDDYSLSHNSIYDIYKDNRGVIWVATYFGGLSIYDAKGQVFDYYKPKPNSKNALSYHVVGQFVETKDNKVWIATEGGGLNLFDPSSKKFINFSNVPHDPSSLPDDNIKAICQNKEGNLWLAMLTQGLVHFDTKTKKAKRYNAQNSSLRKNNISSLLIDHKGILWVGTQENLYQFDEGKNDFIEFRLPKNENPYNTKYMIEDHNHTIWIGTLGNGLYSFNRETNKITLHPLEINVPGTSGNNLINFLMEDSHHNIWVGTLGNGLLKFNPKDNSYKTYYTNDGLANNIVFGIVEDNKGLLWVSTSSGLSRFDPNTESFTSYGVNSNLPLVEFNEGSCYKTENGSIYMGGLNGFISFLPDNISDNKVETPIVLTDFKIGNKHIFPGGKDGILHQSINEQNHIFLGYEDRNLSISYANLNYLLSGENLYAYKLDGFDEDWNFVGSRREANYTNLPPGQYTLHIKTYDNERVLNPGGKSIAISISSPPWKSWWAYVAYIVAICIALYLLSATLQYKANMEKNLELEHLEKTKIEELNNFKLGFYTNISHEFRTHLTLIISPLERLISSKAGDSRLRKQHQLIYKNANRLQNLINELMDFRKIETNNLDLKVGKGNIVKFINEIKISFDEYARERGVSFSMHENYENIQLYFDRDQLEKVFFNLLSNAFKFTGKTGTIGVSVQKNKEGNNVKIIVRDSGVGMTQAQSQHVFERFYQIETESPKKQKGTGLGLALASEIVKLHHGSIAVESEIGKGTSFIVMLPTGNSHFKPEQIIKDFKDSEHIKPYLNEFPLLYGEESKDMQNGTAQMAQLPENLPLVLVADDNDEIRNHLSSIFKQSYKILEASDGEQALSLAKKHLPELIISDIMMPNMNGIELCSNIKKGLSTSHIPIILLTARTSLIYQVDGLETGADDYVTKPFNAQLLALKAANLIKTRQRLKKYFLAEVDIIPEKITVTPVDEKFMQQAIDIIEDNLDNPKMDVNTFVDLMNVSRSTLFTKLKNLTGQTPNDFIRSIRLKRAAQILQQDRLTNAEVCYMVGFNTPRHFRKCFQDFFGKTPIQYAKDYEILR